LRRHAQQNVTGPLLRSDDVRILVATNAAIGHLLPMASTIAALAAAALGVPVVAPGLVRAVRPRARAPHRHALINSG